MAASKEVYHDFRGQPLRSDLVVIGDPEGRCVQPESLGLRVTIAKPWIHPWGGTGVRTGYGVHGDFEITATFEVLQAETPPTGFGVGVALRVTKVEATPGLATLCRVVRSNGDPVILWDRTAFTEQGERQVKQGVSPGPDTVGRFCLRRTGATLRYLWAPGSAGDNYEEIHVCEFGSEDLRHVELTALTGRQECNVDVRFHDLRVRSADLPADVPVAASPTAGGKTWLPVILSAGMGLSLVLFLGTWLSWRRGRRAAVAPSGAAADKPAQPEAAAPPVSVPCPGCRKMLRVKAALAGNEVKCPACGGRVPVPHGPPKPRA